MTSLKYSLYFMLTFCVASTGFSYQNTSKSKIAFSDSLAKEFSKTKGDFEMIEGTVLKMMHVKSYTYIEIKVKSSKENIWLATSSSELIKGDRIRFRSISPMENFYSKSLKRTFSKIYFVESLEVARKVK